LEFFGRNALIQTRKHRLLAPRITLTIATGPLDGTQFVFDERTTVLLGNRFACRIRFPAEYGLANVKLADGAPSTGRGLVHRDIKPHNLFLARSGDKYAAKIGDYGLAKAFDLAGLSGLTATGAAAGTPTFVPRQQLLEYKYTRPDVDVWALAASLYYVLTLQPPRDFSQGRDPWQVVLQTNPVPIRRRAPAVPARLAAVIDKALIDEPEIGFKTAAEFRTALKEAMG
jgi:hypothetical protein